MIEQIAVVALNHLLRDAQWARERLAPSAGKTVRLAVWPVTVDLAINPDGTLSEVAVERPDVIITLPAGAPLAALGGREALLRQARVTGSAELADTFGFVLRNLRWDYEEDLSQVLGDVAAHRIGGSLRRFGAWQASAANNIIENLGEYLREEQPVFASSALVGEFGSTVDRLRDDLARLEKRIERLSR
jgi:ubiquinone biosynthesis protein UbiJ